MTIPGFTAHRTLNETRRLISRRGLKRLASGVRPAMMILVDGVPYCEGEVTGDGVQCYGGSSGFGGGGNGGGYPGGFASCTKGCRSLCSKNPHAYPAPCYKNCVADC